MVLVGNRKDILELDELSDDCLKANFGYTDAGIENLRDQAKEIRKEEVEEVVWDDPMHKLQVL
jgi:hypothetical protein